jgi:hypothetical protein
MAELARLGVARKRPTMTSDADTTLMRLQNGSDM